jgi:hypothetical protein
MVLLWVQYWQRPYPYIPVKTSSKRIMLDAAMLFILLGCSH